MPFETTPYGAGSTHSQEMKERLDRMFTELYSAYSPKVKHTEDGGIAVKLTNKTGAASVKGYVVTPDDTVENAVKLVPVNEPDAIGVFLESGVADGDEAWVVVSGLAYVYFSSDTSPGYLARTGLTADTGEVAGQALAEAYPTSPFATDKHFCEIGHCLEAITGPGLCKCVLHFN